jgi:hypothetical protein
LISAVTAAASATGMVKTNIRAISVSIEMNLAPRGRGKSLLIIGIFMDDPPKVL